LQIAVATCERTLVEHPQNLLLCLLLRHGTSSVDTGLKQKAEAVASADVSDSTGNYIAEATLRTIMRPRPNCCVVAYFIDIKFPALSIACRGKLGK
jgi:hypothetical protein